MWTRPDVSALLPPGSWNAARAEKHRLDPGLSWVSDKGAEGRALKPGRQRSASPMRTGRVPRGALVTTDGRGPRSGRGPGSGLASELPGASAAAAGGWPVRRAPGGNAGPPAPHIETPGAPPTGVHSSLPGSHGALPSRRPEAMRWAGTPQMAVWGRGGDPLTMAVSISNAEDDKFPVASPANEQPYCTYSLSKQIQLVLCKIRGHFGNRSRCKIHLKGQRDGQAAPFTGRLAQPPPLSSP